MARPSRGGLGTGEYKGILMMSNHPLEKGVKEGSLFGSGTLLKQPTAKLSFETWGDSVA